MPGSPVASYDTIISTSDASVTARERAGARGASRFPGYRFVAHCSGWDALGILFAWLTLLAGCLLKSRRDAFFWYDEVATASLAGDRSLAHMIGAVARGAENNPPLYPALMWVWSRVFGSGTLAMRLPSTFAMCAALAIVWVTARLGYRTRHVAIGVVVGLLTVPVVLDQAFQARFYGLFTLTASVAFALTVTLQSRDRPTRGMLALTALSHALLLYSHTFGTLFSAALLTGLVATDLVAGRRRISPYLAVLAGWLLFAPWIPVILAQGHAVAAPNSWLVRPSRDDLLLTLAGQVRWLPLMLPPLIVLKLLDPADGARVERAGGKWEPRDWLLTSAVALIAVVPLVFVLSRIAAPVFLDRYLLPASIGWCIIVSQLAAAPIGAGIATGAGRRLVAATWAVLFVLGASYPLGHAASVGREVRPDLPPEVGFTELPVVVEGGHDFWPLRYYSRGPTDRFHFLLDWEVATDPAAPAGAAQQYRLMELYQREGYLGGSVAHSRRFLCAERRFLVVDRPDFQLFERRIAPDTGFRSRPVGRYGDAVVRLVEGRAADCVPRAGTPS